jgi:hypothetical protein
MSLRTLTLAAATARALLLAPAAHADNKAITIDEMAGYLEFVDYGGGAIFAEQIPRDDDCNTGSLSAQAGFALRVAGWENVRILQGGMEEWRAKGGFDAAAKAASPAKH